MIFLEERVMNEQIVQKIRETGVIGAGGAGLPTHVKAEAKVETVLVNGASCEPLLMSDPYLLEAKTETVILGLKAIMACTGATRGIICLKGKHKNALAAVQDRISKEPKEQALTLEVYELEDFYPAGDEQVLVHEVLGKTVPERGIPLQVGAVVSNVESLYNVALAMEDVPVTHRYLTVTGEVAKPMVVKAPVGAQVSDVLAFAGGATLTNFKVVDGGPMMGRVLEDIDQPVTKTTSGLIVLPCDHTVVNGKIMDPAKLRRITNTVCCQCSRCTDLCPRNLLGHSLHPHKLMRVLESQVLQSSVAREALLCSECGVCEKYACPMMVSPREVNAQIKRALMAEKVSWEPSGNQLIANRFRKSRAVPTSRLLQRLNLSGYEAYARYGGELTVAKVSLALDQHIGAAAQCVVTPGEHVKKGELVGEIPEGAMGARVHASIDGVVESVSEARVTIKGC